MGENHRVMETPMGPVGLTWEGGTLTGVDLEPVETDGEDLDIPETIVRQLDAYFEDGSRSFDLKLKTGGTDFQRRVWNALREIPPGRTLTYGDLAKRIGTSARAVGGACRANPCPIVVPCHRVVATNGLGGFAGDTSGKKLDVKRWLLRHEGVVLPRTTSGL